MKRLTSTLASLALLLAAGQAMAADKYIIAGFGLSQGTADLATYGGGYNEAYDHSELGGRFEYWNFMKPNYALNFNANLGFFSETAKPGPAAAAGPEGKYTQSSWSVRLGGDRTWDPLPNLKMFMGPGIEYWSGNAKFEDIGGLSGSYKTKNTTRISLHGHLGGIMMMGDNWGLSGQMGHKVGMASYKEAGAESSWWPSSFDGAMEVVFKFGGN